MARHTLERIHPTWSPREREVLDLIARGHTNGEIATELGISFWTAKWHVSELISKLGVESREQVADYWREERRPLARLNRVLARLFAWPALAKAAAGVGTVALGAAGVVLVIAALRGSSPDSPPVTPSATSTATVAASATQQARTGISELDTILAAVESGDEARIESLVRYFDVNCVDTTITIASAGPPCLGNPPGTPLTSFAISDCEERWVGQGIPWIDSLTMREPKFYAAYRGQPSQGFLPTAPKPPHSYMSGEYVLVFRHSALDLQSGVALHVGGGRIVRAAGSCGAFGTLFEGVPLSAFIVLPPGGLPTPTPTPVVRHTGNAASDRLVDAMRRGDWQTLLDAFETYPEPCAANPQGVGSPPKCPPGVPDGGTIMSPRVMACERVYPGDIENIKGYFIWGREVYAAFPSSAIPSAGPYQYSSDWVPAGDITVILRRQGADDGSAWHLANGKITGVRLGCGTTAKQFVEDIPASAFILSPLP